jgi:hypothetical protein
MVIDKNVLTFCGAVCVLVVGSFAFWITVVQSTNCHWSSYGLCYVPK